MKVTEAQTLVGAERAKAVEGAVPSVSGPKDRVSVTATKDVEASVEVAHRAAGGKRAARLERLEAEVRSGTYRPDPSRVAEQILSDAEVDARIAAMLQH
jgi:anti-sigma28 factor (negative regulator of flagellin synthesis)